MTEVIQFATTTKPEGLLEEMKLLTLPYHYDKVNPPKPRELRANSEALVAKFRALYCAFCNDSVTGACYLPDVEGEDGELVVARSSQTNPLKEKRCIKPGVAELANI